MKKILLIITFLVGGISFAEAACEERDKPSCIQSNGDQFIPYCMPKQGIYSNNPIDGNWMCQDKDPNKWIAPPPQTMGGNENNENTIKKEPTKKCLPNQTLVNGICSDCGGTLKPKTISAVIDGWKTFKKVPTLPIGPVKNGFSAGAEIAAGEPSCTYEESAEEKIFNACASAEDAAKTKANPFARLSEGYWDTIYKKCGRITDDKGVVTYPNKGKMNCTKASVIDTLWAFITHKRTR